MSVIDVAHDILACREHKSRFVSGPFWSVPHYNVPKFIWSHKPITMYTDMFRLVYTMRLYQFGV